MTEDEAQAWLQYRQIRHAGEAFRVWQRSALALSHYESDERESSSIRTEQFCCSVVALHRRRSMGGVSNTEGGQSRREAMAVLLAGGVERACSARLVRLIEFVVKASSPAAVILPHSGREVARAQRPSRRQPFTCRRV